MRAALGLVLCLLVTGAAGPAAQQSDVIRVPTRSDDAGTETEQAVPIATADPIRRGFDHAAFETRLESLWFQRKTLLADGREADAQRQADLMRSFCREEGVQRLEFMAGALVAEAGRFLEEGRYERALDALAFAGNFDPGRPQIHFLRAAVHWQSSHGLVAAAQELFLGLRASIERSVLDLSLFGQIGIVLVLAMLGCLVAFSVLMLVRHNVSFRHEVEEWLGQFLPSPWGRVGGWTLVALPLLLWFSAGWVAIYWIVITFRLMRRAERVAAVVLLLVTAVSVPTYRVGVGLYRMTADPMVRATLVSSSGGYNPDRVIKLQRLVNAYPDEATYHFLLAGLYKSGRYFEEAFAEYKAALDLDPYLEEALINIGNIYYMTSQHAEAIATYRKALDLNPRSVLAHFNSHLAQSQAFRFKEAEASLMRAREIDPELVARLLAGAGREGSRPPAPDAKLQSASIWQAALEGRTPREALQRGPSVSLPRHALAQLANPVSAIALLALLACGISLLASRGQTPARRCIRCGRPFCHYCRSSRQGQEYCSQCYHLYVLGDGLAPEAKSHKLYEVERHERRNRRGRRLISWVLPGAAHVLRGRPGRGTALLLLWFAGLIAWQPLVLRPLERLAGMELRLDLLRPSNVPAMFDINPHAFLGVMLLVLAWLLGNVWRFRVKER